MTNLLTRYFKLFCFVAIVLVCLMTGSHTQGIQQAGAQTTPTASSEQPVPSFPPGAVAIFMQPVKLDKEAQLPVVYLKLPGSDAAGHEWTLEANLTELEAELPSAPIVGSPVKPEPVAVPAPAEPQVAPEVRPNMTIAEAVPVDKKQFISFVVPQLSEGTYVAYYEIPGGAKESMLLSIAPQLYVADGLVEGKPGDVVKVRVGIDTMFILRKDEMRPVQRQIDITLRSEDMGVADLAPGQSPTVKTDNDGYGTWKVRINRSGTAILTATAPQFEQAQVYVAGTQPASEEMAHLAREVQKAEAVAISEEEEARRKQAELEKLTKELLAVEQELAQSKMEQAAMSDVAARTAEADKSSQTARRTEGRPKREKNLQAKRDSMTALVKNVETKVMHERMEVFTALRQLNAVEARFDAVSRPPFSVADLLPGDVLLVQGSGFVSSTIRFFEGRQLSMPGTYSHAALYVGELGGGKMVAEMLKQGHTLNPLEVSMRGAGIVDVYRWPGLSDDRRARIAANGRQYNGKLYAFPQLDVLRKAAGLKLSLMPLGAYAAAVDLISGGKKQMICSELVSWAYHDAGLDPQATRFWPSLGSILTSDERHHDYTTPNTLAERNSSFRQVGRLKGPR